MICASALNDKKYLASFKNKILFFCKPQSSETKKTK